MNFEERYKWALTNNSDINEHIPVLVKYASGCKRITEFGVRGAVSTMAWISASPEKLDLYDINVPDCISDLYAICKEMSIDLTFMRQDTKDALIDETDLLFLDTTHNHETLFKELVNNHKAVSKFIILHDTELNGWDGEKAGRGIKVSLIEFLLCNTNWRIKEHLTNSCGLTILERA